MAGRTPRDRGGAADIVEIASSQLGNVGGRPYWSWYGFESRVEWCACFVSWCANECGYIDSGAVPKFSYCPTGVQWFKAAGRWLPGGSAPAPGDIVFFDWDGDGVSDHVGIVESGATAPPCAPSKAIRRCVQEKRLRRRKPFHYGVWGVLFLRNLYPSCQ